MNIAAVKFPIFNPYNKPTIEIYVSGCQFNCPNCHNKELQNFDYGSPYDIEYILSYMQERDSFFDCISLTGGDLLWQSDKYIYNILEELSSHFPLKEFWLFTGFEFNNIPVQYLKYFNYIKTGKYIHELSTNNFPASSNQKIWKREEEKWTPLL